MYSFEVDGDVDEGELGCKWIGEGCKDRGCNCKKLEGIPCKEMNAGECALTLEDAKFSRGTFTGSLIGGTFADRMETMYCTILVYCVP